MELVSPVQTTLPEEGRGWGRTAEVPLPEVQARMPGRAVAVLASVHVSGGKVKLCGLGSISAL